VIHLLLTFLLSPLLRLLAGRAPTPPRRVLVIQLAKIGDLLCSTPVFRELKRSFPEVELHVMASKVNVPLLQANPHVDHIVEADARDFGGVIGKAMLASKLRKGHYDTLICLNSGAAYATAALWAGVPRRMSVLSNFAGSTHRLAARLWTDVEAHHGDRLIQETYLALLARVGVKGGRIDKDAYATTNAAMRCDELLGTTPGELIGIAVSSANRLKALGNEKIVAVGRQILDARPNARLVLTGGGEDHEQAEAIVAQLPTGRVINICGACGLAEMPKLLEKFSVFLGVDSGLTYMADAVGVPLVSVAGPCNMRETRPLGVSVKILQRSDLPCAPCAHIFRAPYICHTGTRACTREIDANQIAKAVIGLEAVKGS
jgi:heptosyltransferase-2